MTLDAMEIEFDVEIAMDDGISLRADVFRPCSGPPAPVLLSCGPYGKGVHYEDGQPYQWQRLIEDHPQVLHGTSSLLQNWEVVDPERWVPSGYAVVRVDSRGAGRSPGYLDLLSPRETMDLYHCIEWAGTRPWSSGRVGLTGISYYAINQWQVAALRPPHLAAMCVWEGSSDIYREMAFNGGVWNCFTELWYLNRVVPRQHGMGRRGFRSRLNGEFASGPETLPDEVLTANRSDLPVQLRSHPFMDEFWDQRVPRLSEIDVPLLSAANWGGAGLHLRGNIEGFLRAGSAQKWLEIHSGPHWASFYTEDAVALQQAFFDRFLLERDNGFDRRPAVSFEMRSPEGRPERREADGWPVPETVWTKLFLDLAAGSLVQAEPSVSCSVGYDPFAESLTFLTPPLAERVELAGPVAARLYVSSETEDADLFLVLRAFDSSMREVTFHGANAPHAPLTLGWLRLSHRELDAALSTTSRPFHRHRCRSEVTPGEVYEVDVEIWPTSVILSPNHRLALTVSGRDYQWAGAEDEFVQVSGVSATANPLQSGVGPYRHANGMDRPPAVFGGKVTVHSLPGRAPFVVLPVLHGGGRR